MSNQPPGVYLTTDREFTTLDENAGYDLRANESCVIPPGKRALVKTDLKLWMPNTMYAQGKSRSGLALKGIDAKGGVIDAGYRGFVGVILHNYSDTDFVVTENDRIAQLIFLPVIHPTLIKASDEEDLPTSKRGENGFGSSGTE